MKFAPVCRQRNNMDSGSFPGIQVPREIQIHYIMRFKFTMRKLSQLNALVYVFLVKKMLN